MPKHYKTEVQNQPWTTMSTGTPDSSSSCLPCKRGKICKHCGGKGCPYCVNVNVNVLAPPRQQQYQGCQKCKRRECRGECSYDSHRCSVYCQNPCPYFCPPQQYPPCPQPYPQCPQPYCPQPTQCGKGGFSFSLPVVPATNLNPNRVTFTMKKAKGVVFLQWQQFNGTVGANGTAYLAVPQTLCDLPPYPVTFPLVITYNSVAGISKLVIDPTQATDNIRFYLNVTGTGTGVTTSDTFTIPGSSVQWISSC